MTRLPRLTAKDVVRILEKNEFVLSRQSGSHMIFKNKDGKRVTVPYHASVILHPKILKNILRDADLSVDTLL